MISKTTKVIGITTRRQNPKSYSDPRECLSYDWFSYASRKLNDYLFVPLPNHPQYIDQVLADNTFDYFILSNGNDLGSEPERDEIENNIISRCIKHRIPLLGVCRGFQMIAKYFGGEIVSIAGGHVNNDHSIRIISLTNKIKNYSVNSFHNFGLKDLKKKGELVPFAASEDDIIEGVVHQNLPILAIQWHNERNHEDRDFTDNLIDVWLKNNSNRSLRQKMEDIFED